MRRLLLVAALLVSASLSSASPAAQAPVRNEPGMPTIGRIFVLNKERGEAIPVNVQSAGDVIPVTVMGAPAVTLAANTALGARTLRQAWEYRQLSLPIAADPTEALNAAGAEGWEAVGAASGGASRTTWILKRPR